MHSLRPYVFLSYSRADDEPFVEHLRARLEDAGISVWWDRASMESRGRRFLHEIQEAIEHCDRLIAVIGPGALSSPYVRYEWEHALLFARAVTPVLRLVNYKEFEDQSKVRDVFALNDDWSKLHCVDFRASRPFDEACEELLRIARTLAAPLGNLYGVPALPPNLLPRPEQLQAISDGLLSDLNAPHAVTSSFAICASHGMGGAGKSVLAAAIGRSTQIRRAFPAGIFWLPMNREDHEDATLNTLRQLGAALGDSPDYADVQSACHRLSNLLFTRRCLLILDDVWTMEAAKPFVNSAGPSMRLLITTRMETVVSDLGARIYELGVLSNDEAFKLLASWLNVDWLELPPAAKRIAEACGNLPLALAMIGAILRANPQRIDYVLDRLARADLAALKRRLPNYGHPNLLRAMEVSVDALDACSKAAYLSLAVFPLRTGLPDPALACYFGAQGFSEPDTYALIDTLVGRSLARRIGPRLIQLHDLQHAYINGLCERPDELHRKLVEAYRSRCPEGWPSGPDDDYFYQHLPFHLAMIGADKELPKLLRSFDWLHAKLDILQCSDPPVGANMLVHDFNLAFAHLRLTARRKTQLDRLRLVLAQALHALDEGAPLAQQLLARLAPSDGGALRSVVAAARKWCGNSWLEPVSSSLRQVHGPLRTYSSQSPALTRIALLEPEGQVVCGTLDMYGNIVIIDLASGRVLRVLSDDSVKYSETWDGEAGIIALAVGADHRTLLSCAEHERCVKVWDLARGAVITRLDTGEHVHVIVTIPNQNRIAAITDSELSIWDLTSFKCVARLEGVPAERNGGTGQVRRPTLSTLAVDSSGDYAVAGDSRGNVLLFDLVEARLTGHVQAHQNATKAVAIDSASRLVLSSSWDKPVIRIFRFPDLTSAGALDGSHPAHHLSPLGRFGSVIWAASADSLSLWDVSKRQKLCQYDRHGSWINHLEMDADGHAVVGYGDGTVTRWERRTAAEAHVDAAHAHASPVSSLAMQPDGRCVASSTRDDHDVVLWDCATGLPRRRLQGHEAGHIALTMMPDGCTLISAGKDRRMIAWDVDTGQEIRRVPVDVDNIACLVWMNFEDQTAVVCGSDDGRVVLVNPADGRLLKELPRAEIDRHWRSSPASVRSLAVDPARGLLVIGTENNVETWNPATLERVDNYDATDRFGFEDHMIVALCVLSDGRIASASSDGHAIVRRLDPSRTQPDRLDDDSLPLYTASIARSEDGKVLIVATREAAVRVLCTASEFKWVCAFYCDSAAIECARSSAGRIIGAGDFAGNVHVLRLHQPDTS